MKARVPVSTADQRAKVKAQYAEEYASALKRTLVVLPYVGACACGLTLTERDRDRGKKSYTCPRCGRSGRVEPLKKVEGLKKAG